LKKRLQERRKLGNWEKENQGKQETRTKEPRKARNKDQRTKESKKQGPKNQGKQEKAKTCVGIAAQKVGFCFLFFSNALFSESDRGDAASLSTTPAAGASRPTTEAPKQSMAGDMGSVESS
jgi:hypothetical protein